MVSPRHQTNGHVEESQQTCKYNQNHATKDMEQQQVPSQIIQVR